MRNTNSEEGVSKFSVNQNRAHISILVVTIFIYNEIR
jgi:hypothetical protein